MFLRWRFTDGDGRPRSAVRAVDTATHPDHQGRGIFRRLTLGAVDELQADGVDFVFNTPNDQSRPGYLKMGWQAVGRVPDRGAAAVARGGLPHGPGPHRRRQVVATDDRRRPRHRGPGRRRRARRRCWPRSTGPPGLATDRTVEHLRWRYRFEPLAYRAVVAPGGVADGLAVFRVRDRGAATEAVLCEVLVPDGDRRLGGRLVRDVARHDRRRLRHRHHHDRGPEDRPSPSPARPGPHPHLARRRPDRTDADRWPTGHLTMGDVELF